MVKCRHHEKEVTSLSNKYLGYIGTYTKGDSKGIYTFTLDAEKRELQELKLAAELENPTYVAISHDNKFLYSVAKSGENGGIASYSINPENGELQSINQQLLKGASPCHVSINQDNSLAVTANYHKGTIESYSVNSNNGKVSPAASVSEHSGSGPNKDRQEKPHAHYSGFTPDEKFVAAIDLGIDKLITYKVTGPALSELRSFTFRPGSGPRHLAFHPNRKFAYVMTELSSEVVALEYDQVNGSFTELQYISAIPADFQENNQGSAIHISSDGRFVYAANRGHDSIAVFQVNQDNGELSFVEHTSTEGEWPRDFALDPSEQFLVVSNQETSSLALFKRDQESGKLSLIQSNVSVPFPVCVKFLRES
ncbi:6-phosphogluconolactonase [Bacillus sp. M6-12]|uniref:lactonase family protein n=1 Tax=Bacillus sp. M6-12 TaxID=2054166 RepID=UPI000C77BD7F|nr:lactonase family protein [Bacillus sp. M6-12]PLS18288.1 6-phosphogluconolactonase [Bacillus sp. M6-12]